MGSFEDTCALTNTPIYQGDKCVMVVVSKTAAKNKSFGILGLSSELMEVEVITKGTYDDRGWLTGLPDPEGSNSNNRDDWQHLRSIFFHASAWDLWKKQKHHVKPIEDQRKVVDQYTYDISDEKKALLAEFLSVAKLAEYGRRDIFSGLCSKGKQEWKEQKEAQRLIHEASGRLLARRRPREDE